MKSLVLYIDKWYIVGANCGDGTSQPLRGPHGDDRIWLFFYNNRQANEVSYGSKYKEEAFAEKIDYYKDIFKLIPTVVGATFKRFGRNVDIRTIFSAAGIFQYLRANYQKDERIRTFISFSPDISYLAQSVFLSLLKEHDFEVVEYVAHIGYLTLEYANRHKLIEKSDFILVANACNENLRFALYKQDDEMFVCKKEYLYEGLGIDLRKRAILEQVVENLNAETRFVCNETEEKEEYKYLQQYVDEWIKFLDADETSLYTPICLGNLHFKKQQGNDYPISVMRNEIDSRTAVIIEDIINAMFRMLSESNIDVQRLSHIVFLGNAFENSIFEKSLIQRTGLNTSRILHFREEQLSEIVSVYAEIDCAQFKEAEYEHKKRSEAEKEQAEQAKFEREALEEARKKEEEAKAIRYEEEQKQKDLDDAMEYAQNAERDEKLEEAFDFYKIALDLAPQNQQIKNKIEELGNKIADARSKKKLFDEYIEKAKQCIDDKKWDEAVVQSQMALGVMPQSDEAMQILNRAKDMSLRYARLKECLSQIDFFIGQGAFDKAHEELRHAELLKLNDVSIEDRKLQIINKQKEKKEKIENEIKVLEIAQKNENFDLAIQQCEVLINIDIDHQSQWVERKATIISTREKVLAEKKHFQELIDDIEKALLNEEWERLKILCIEALKIKNDANIQEKLSKAQKKIQYADAQKQFDNARDNEDWKRVIDCCTVFPFLREIPENNRTIRYARRLLRTKKNNIGFGDETILSDNQQPQTEKQGNSKRHIGAKRNHMPLDNPISLLQEPIVDISIKIKKKQFPRPKSRIETLIDEKDEEVRDDVTPSPIGETEKRKFPKVSHIKK